MDAKGPKERVGGHTARMRAAPPEQCGYHPSMRPGTKGLEGHRCHAVIFEMFGRASRYLPPCSSSSRSLNPTTMFTSPVPKSSLKNSTRYRLISSPKDLW